MTMMDDAIGFCEGISQMAQKRQAYSDAFWKAQPRCGSCQHWMKRPDCPRERGVMVGGPTADQIPCGQFTGTEHHHQFVAAFEAIRVPNRSQE